MSLVRQLRHWFVLPGAAHRAFDAPTMRAIAEAIRAGEARHQGEVRFAVEAALPWSYLRRDAPTRQRALMAFAKLGVWDTEHNSGVLLYLNLADRDVEIIADRGVAHRVGTARWEAICQAMEAEFRARRWREGALQGIARVHEALAEVLPAEGERRNEVSDRPVIL